MFRCALEIVLIEVLEDPDAVREATDCAHYILDAKYEKADLNELVSNLDHLDQSQKQKLKSLLFKYEHLFDGTLGQFDDDPVDFELKDGAKPYAAKPYGLPASIEDKLRRELERFCDIGVMRHSSPSEWASPTFATPKKNHQI